MNTQRDTRHRGSAGSLAVVLLATSLLIPIQPAAAQTQPCPVAVLSAGFDDLGGLDQETVAAIDCITFFGITRGTSATTFTPDGRVIRWQMALFLIRTASALGMDLPGGSPQGFTDIRTLDAEAREAINQLAQLGITKGTSATTFSPNADVTRGQMSLFLTRLADAAGTVLPQCPPIPDPPFPVGNPFCGLLINPDAVIVRWQMAVLLAYTLHIVGVSTPPSSACLTVFGDDFEADGVGVTPSTSPAGEPPDDALEFRSGSAPYVTVVNSGPHGSKAARITRGSPPPGVVMGCVTGGGPHLAGSYSATFEGYSAVENGLVPRMTVSLRSASGHRGAELWIDDLNYVLNSGAGSEVVGSYTVNGVDEITFEIDMTGRSVSLKINGITVATGKPFLDPGFVDLDRLEFAYPGAILEAWGEYQVDDIRICKR